MDAKIPRGVNHASRETVCNMLPSDNGVGPDLVICGAARAGTSFLASLLGSHPAIDPGAVKEPNFYSREFGRGFEWYNALYKPREPGMMRLDASTSYTSPRFPEGLQNLSRHAPGALLIYAVREPLHRALSHYQHNRDYLRNEVAPTFGAALQTPQVYTGASDYGRWLDLLYHFFDEDQVIVVPFAAITDRTSEVVGHICRRLDLDAEGVDVDNASSTQHRNQVVEFRHDAFRRALCSVRRSGLYPRLRRTIGADRLRALRARITRPARVESLTEALSTCEDEQLRTLDQLYVSAQHAVSAALTAQDTREALLWAPLWAAACPRAGSVDVRDVESLRHSS